MNTIFVFIWQHARFKDFSYIALGQISSTPLTQVLYLIENMIWFTEWE